MKERTYTWQNGAFVLVFVVLTFFCWCPLGYGRYGPVERFLGMPFWAVLAFAFAVALFLVEWVYLFRTPMAMNDEELPGIVSQLEAVDTEKAAPAQEDE